jgi:GWxTD domain-containing protein
MSVRGRLAGAFVLVLGVACTSAPPLPRQPQSLYADAWLTWHDGGRAVVQIVVDVPVRELLRPGEPGAPDRLLVTAVLRDHSGKVLESHSWPTELPRDNLSLTVGRQEKQLFVPRAGRVSLELGILVRGRVLLTGWHRQWSIEALPPLRVAWCEPVFLDPDHPGEVRLSRVFGEHEAVVLQSGLYVPAAAVPADSIRIDWQALEGDRPEGAGRIRVAVRPDRVSLFSLRLPRLLPGVHRVQLSCAGVNAGAGVGSAWQIVPQIDTWSDSLPPAEVLKVILPADEMQRLQQAPPTQRLRAWRDALQRLFPGPPEAALDVLQQRWQEASIAFVEPQRPGWRTDRGRVYIRRGAPDEIEQLRDPETQERLERWRYRATNHVFVFRDRNGTGDWVLERSNDPTIR